MRRALVALVGLASVATAAPLTTISGTLLSHATTTGAGDTIQLSLDTRRAGILIVVDQTGTGTTDVELSVDGGATWGSLRTFTDVTNASEFFYAGVGMVRANVTTCTGCDVTVQYALGQAIRYM
jgi:hypothetical protein